MLSMFMALIDSAEQQTKFEKIYYAYRKQMFITAKSVLGNNEQTEDAVQEAFLSIAKQIGHIQDNDEKKLRAYVLTVAHHAALDIQKKEMKYRNGGIPFEEKVVPNPEDLIVEAEATDELTKVIRKLPAIYQEVLMMKIVQELDYSEIADILHRPQATIRQQTARAKKMLSELCGKEGAYVCI